MARGRVEQDELKTMINTFRCSDLISLLGSVGRNRSGRKNELQLRAIDILRSPPSDINMEVFKRKIRELYRAAQDEAKQTHGLELQQQLMQNNMGRAVLAAQHNAVMQRPLNPYGASPYHHTIQQRSMTNANTVYQGGMGGVHNSYPPGMYGQSSTHSAAAGPPTTAPICNFSDNILIISQSNSMGAGVMYASSVAFRKLPFYNIRHEILKPTILTANSHSTLSLNQRTSATQEFHLSFVLSCAMASDIAMNRDISNGKSEYNVHAQLRICAFDNNSITSNLMEYDDFLPFGLVVRMNSKTCQLPAASPNTRSGTESRRIPRPINVTAPMRMSPMNANHLIVNWALESGKTFVITINLVEKLTSAYLLNKLKERPMISVDVTKATIKKQYKRIDDDDDDDKDDADDDDIATTIVRVSLVCPLAKFRMMYPAKGRNCSHLQCFDGSAYISLNEKKPHWMCPVCNRALYYDDLLLDQYFMNVLKSDELSEDCQEVQLLVDGSWKSYDEDNVPNNEDRRNSDSPNAASPSLLKAEGGETDPSTNSEVEDRKENAISEMQLDVNNAINAGPVVDLTEEEEEEMPQLPVQEPSPTADEPGTQEEHIASPILNDTDEHSSSAIEAPSLASPSEETVNSVEPNDTSPISKNVEHNETHVDTPELPSTETNPSAVVSSSGYTSPIISLDSPSPPSSLHSPRSALAALNIVES